MPFRKKHITELRSVIRINEPNRSEINQVIDLYQSRQIPRLDTAKLLIEQLQSRGKAKNKKAIDRLADYTTNEPAVERRQRLVFEKSIIKSIEYLHDSSARPVVKISLNTNIRLVPDEVLFRLDIEGQHSKLFDATAFACEKTILNEILKKQSKYKNMKVMLGLNLDIYRVEIEDIENYRDRAKGELVDRKMTDEEIQSYIRKSTDKEKYMVYYNRKLKHHEIIVVRNVHYSSKLRTIINRNVTLSTVEQLYEACRTR